MQPLTSGLILFYQVLGQNLGLAILAFSVFLIFIMKPLTKPYMESMKKIKELEPQLAKLRAKYGKDKLKFSQAQTDLYKEKKINPAAGCIPYLLQFVILIALFRVFTGTLSTDGKAVATINKYLYTPLKFSQTATLNTKFLYLDISKPDTFQVPGLPFALPGLFLLLAAVAQFLSVKITAPYISAEKKIAQKTKGQADDMQVAMQQSMTYTLPLMTLVFGFRFPSGLALYWLVFSVVNVLQQVQTSGWGGLTPLIKRLGLIQSKTNEKGN